MDVFCVELFNFRPGLLACVLYEFDAVDVVVRTFRMICSEAYGLKLIWTDSICT